MIQTSSQAANIFGRGFTIDDLNNERGYQASTAYGHAKLENILFTRELDRRHRSDGLSAVAFHPGAVRSNFASDSTPAVRLVYGTPLKYLFMISPAHSAKRLVALAGG